MPHPFDRARMKVARADEHFKTFHAEIEVFLKSQPYLLACECKLQGRSKVWKTIGPPPPIPTHATVVIGDALHNLRSALDHLAWQLVLTYSGQTSTHTAFPIFSTAPLKPYNLQSRIKGMHPAAAAKIEALQPYKRSHPYRDEMYLMLENLDIIDKHRHLNLVVGGLSGGFWSRPLSVSAETFIHFGPLEDGTEVARLPAEYMDVDFYPTFDVVFGDKGPRWTHRSFVNVAYSGLKLLVNTLITDFDRPPFI